MAYIKSNGSTNVWGRLHYVFDTAAHDGSSHRVLATCGNQLRLWGGNRTPSAEQSGYYLNQQFKSIRRLAKNPNKKRQAQHLIVSFSESEFSTANAKLTKKGAQQVNKLVNGFMMQHFSEAQWVCGVQCDGEGHKLHAHIIINTIKPDGKCVRTNKFGVQPLREQWNQYLDHNYLSTTGHAYVNPFRRNKPRKQLKPHGWQEALIATLNWARENADSVADYLLLLRKRKVTVSKRNQKGDWSYHTHVNGKEKTVRDFYQRIDKKTGNVLSTRGLGAQFTPNELEKYFNNLKQLNEQKSKNIKEADKNEKQTNQSRQGLDGSIQQPIGRADIKQKSKSQSRIKHQRSHARHESRPSEPLQRHRQRNSEPEAGPEL